ncbi:MAG: YHS domain-containing (seleno)protein [Planctomycetota bacterium]|jgi:YHS domain-containing protein
MNSWNCNNNNVAINGWDCVSWCQGSPQQGQANYSCTHDGCTWWFCNEKNLNTFQSNPSQWTPQYGGFCAFGVSQGQTCDINPNCWIVIDNNLFLFANDECKSNWQANQNACCTTANNNWAKGNLAAA